MQNPKISNQIVYFYFLKVIVYVNSNVYLLYHLQGGTDVLCYLLLLPVQAAFPPWCLSASLGVAPVPLSALESLWFFADWTGFMGGVGGWLVGVCQFDVLSAYLNRANPAPSSHCGLCTLILCAGNIYPRIHRCVARTKVMAILLLKYSHVFE